jgi:hypothetical protein
MLDFSQPVTTPIPVSLRLPDDHEKVLIFTRTWIEDGEWQAGSYYKRQWLVSCGADDCTYFPLDHATHWLPLPPSPE